MSLLDDLAARLRAKMAEGLTLKAAARECGVRYHTAWTAIHRVPGLPTPAERKAAREAWRRKSNGWRREARP